MAFYFVEIVPVPGTQKTSAHILSEVQQVIVKHIRQDALRFKVFGEHKIMFIGQDDEPEKVLADIDTRVGQSVCVTTSPLRIYETFAENALGVDKELCTPITTAFENPQKIIFIHVTLSMPGMGMDEFLKMWKEEALSVLIPRAEGKSDFRLFKVVAKRVLFLFFNVPSADVVDDLSRAVPFALNPKTADGLLAQTLKELKPF